VLPLGAQRKTGAALANLSEGAMYAILSRFAADDTGVTAIEYGVIAALLAVVILSAVSVVGTNLSNTFSSIAASL
jgi:pilus assembly protein Flp/PilA